MPPLPPRDFPSPDTTHPVILPDGTHHKDRVFLKAAINSPNIEVGLHLCERAAYHADRLGVSSCAILVPAKSRTPHHRQVLPDRGWGDLYHCFCKSSL